MEPDPTIFSIGHSTHSWERFEFLLRSAGITAIADVRSAPYSSRTPHFSQEELRGALRYLGIVYSFLGRELGGRPKAQQFYREGVADYEKMAQAPTFADGIKRVLQGASKYRIALLCSEHDPLDCHRCLLVSRGLSQQGAGVEHILSDGSLQSQEVIEERLLKLAGRPHDDFFSSREERISAAYRERARRVAFAEPSRTSMKAAE
jgi:uncharacterized protein (DUF488 family)